MTDYPEGHLCYNEEEGNGGLLVGGMFPVIYDWDESEVVRRYALAVGLEAGKDVEVWVSFTCFTSCPPTLDAISIGPAQHDVSDGGCDEDSSIVFSDRPDIDFAELRRYVISDALEGLPRKGVDVTGVLSALDLEGTEK